MPDEYATPPDRTVCHTCRSAATRTEQTSPGTYRIRTMIVPGEGIITRAVASTHGDGGAAAGTEDCPVCGDSEEPGWIPGCTPPV
ncbi:MAG TPA: hypothetical protein VG756_28575 [Pseudonocardiaceae bacterium]|nr:hypothetical protein [Pseudonocardiaceae bacterium]